MKEIEENLFELEKNLSRLKKYCDYGDAEYRGMRNVGNIFNQSIDGEWKNSIKNVN